MGIGTLSPGLTQERGQSVIYGNRDPESRAHLEESLSVSPGNQDPELGAYPGERPDDKDAEASAFRCGKSVVWVNRENPQLPLLHPQEPGVHAWGTASDPPISCRKASWLCAP